MRRLMDDARKAEVRGNDFMGIWELNLAEYRNGFQGTLDIRFGDPF